MIWIYESDTISIFFARGRRGFANSEKHVAKKVTIENWVWHSGLSFGPWQMTHDATFFLMALMLHWLRTGASALPRVGVWASHLGFVLRSPAGWSCRQRVPWRHLLPNKLTCCLEVISFDIAKTQSAGATMEFNSSSEEEADVIEGMFNQLRKIAGRNDDDSWSKSKWWGQKSVLQRL